MMQWNEDVVDLEPNFVQLELFAHLSKTKASRLRIARLCAQCKASAHGSAVDYAG